MKDNIEKLARNHATGDERFALSSYGCSVSGFKAGHEAAIVQVLELLRAEHSKILDPATIQFNWGFDLAAKLIEEKFK